MSIALRIIERPRPGEDEIQPGDMWRYPEGDEDGIECWAIYLPNQGGTWCTTDREGGTGHRWEVTGTPPRITVRPSLNALGHWHGWITDGVMDGA